LQVSTELQKMLHSIHRAYTTSGPLTKLIQHSKFAVLLVFPMHQQLYHCPI